MGTHTRALSSAPDGSTVHVTSPREHCLLRRGRSKVHHTAGCETGNSTKHMGKRNVMWQLWIYSHSVAAAPI